MNQTRNQFVRASLAASLMVWSGLAAAVCHPQPQCLEGGTAPAVSLTAPTNGATTTAPGTFVLTATASDDVQVDGVEFFSNNVSVGVDSTAPYSVTLGGLAAGSYILKAKATDDEGLVGNSNQITVTVTVPANAPPSVSLTSPSAGATYTAPATVVLSATASDSDGTIASVKFKQGSTVLNTDTTYPYSYSWTGVAAGTYTITAVATDNAGATATTTGRNITVNAAPANVAPTVTLTAPVSGTSTTTSTNVTLSATAADSDGTVASVKFFAGGTLIATDSTSPYSATYQTSTAGTYAITAVATDNSGATATSVASTLTVNAPGTVSETRSYVYDDQDRLCKTINPESGATVIEYDGDDNILWTADGLNLPSTTSCDRGSVTAAQKTTRTYDALNRVTSSTTTSGTADVATTYFADGKVASLTAANPGGSVTTTYGYNNRRLLESESTTNGLFLLSYYYTGNGSLSAIGYPGTEVVSYNPDALGRPTLVASGTQTYASAIGYFPNGAMSTFKYGSATGGGPTHTLTQNARRLPEHSTDTQGATKILDDTYKYDANGNVTDIIDAAQTGSASQTRGMGYDGLDRLTTAVGPWGNATYTFDALDNLRTANQGTRQFRYSYDATTWRLSTVKDAGGSTLYSFGYDARGNQTSKVFAASSFTQLLPFDAANRLSAASTISGSAGSQAYTYDGLGRRVQVSDPDGTPSDPTDNPTSYWVYSQAGQLLFSSEARRSRNLAYIYLNGSQIATRSQAWYPLNTVTVRFQMTDALGTPVADTTTSGTGINRTSYTPWGEATPAVDGTGYTGHVMDANTGLTYMQQRYYDPLVGRFLGVDPIGTNPSTGASFNRYAYANNNPYSFFDPDGREPAKPKCEDVKCKQEEQARREKKGNEPFSPTTRVTTVVSPPGTPMMEHTKKVGSAIDAAFRKNGNENCGYTCPTPDGGFATEIGTNGGHNWCESTPCTNSVSPASDNHNHVKRFLANEGDVAHRQSSLRVGQYSSGQREAPSPVDQAHAASLGVPVYLFGEHFYVVFPDGTKQALGEYK